MSLIRWQKIPKSNIGNHHTMFEIWDKQWGNRHSFSACMTSKISQLKFGTQWSHIKPFEKNLWSRAPNFPIRSPGGPISPSLGSLIFSLHASSKGPKMFHYAIKGPISDSKKKITKIRKKRGKENEEKLGKKRKNREGSFTLHPSWQIGLATLLFPIPPPPGSFPIALLRVSNSN